VLATRPARPRYAHGAARTAGWLTGPIESHLCCPRGHRIYDGGARDRRAADPLHFQEAPHAPRCNLLVWVIVTRPGAVFAAEVDFDDVKAIKAHPNVYTTLVYLGAALWPAAPPRS
jgi:hypothetical protein